MAVLNINNRTITVSKESLLTALKENRAIHAAEYEVAVAEFSKRLEDDLKTAMKIVKKGNFEDMSNIRVIAQAPVSHLPEFDEAIEMLEFSLSDELEIDTNTFKAYVKNEWTWTKNFKKLIDSYKIAGSMLV